MNQLIENNLPLFDSLAIQVLWQCGRLYYDDCKKWATANVHIYPFINEMNLVYAAADIILSRAGASSISELCLVGKPTLFIPSPNVAENHQFHNANALVKQNAAILLEEKELEEKFENTFKSLLGNHNLQLNLSKELKNLAKPAATADIVNCIHHLNENNA